MSSPSAPFDGSSEPTFSLGDASRRTTATRSRILSWALWDWGMQPFNTVILTFVFTALYLTTEAFLPTELQALDDGAPAKERALADLAGGLGVGTTVAGLLILLLAPVLGQRADARGRQKLWLGLGTAGTIGCMLGLWFAEPAPTYFWFAVALISAGTVLGEIAAVNNNALLTSIAKPHDVGRLSGLGWGFGYIGGVVMLVLVVVFYAADWFGVSADDGVPFRLIAVGCAVWAIVFTLPVFLKVPEPAPQGRPERRTGILTGYAMLIRDVVGLYRTPATRSTFWFLVASAVYRDGLSGVFTFGAIIGAQVFGFDTLELVAFGIAANLIAGVSTILAGRIDDRFGPKVLIVVALMVMVAAGLAVFALADRGPLVFWVGGLTLTACVGPAQSAGRSFLARVTPSGREGEVFGLYATTGRAASWMSSLAWTLLVATTGATVFGILGIAAVLLLGLLLILPVRAPASASGPASG